MPKLKIPPTDGLGPREIKKVRAATRQCWHRSHARKIAVKRSISPSGFFCCELCKTDTREIKIDHKVAVGDMDDGYLTRLFCPSSGLQAICKKCHDIKTKAERAQNKKKKD